MQHVWSRSIRNLLGPARPKPKPSQTTVELNSRYHWVDQNESQSSIERERDGNNEDAVNPEASQGVQKAEAVALVWTKKSAYGTYAWIYVCVFMLGLHLSIEGKAEKYARHDDETKYNEKIQLTMEIVQKVLGTVLQLPAARLLNVWGRAEGFLVFIGVYLIGIIVLATNNNLTTWIVGYAFYSVGYKVIYFIVFVFITDITEMRHRALAMTSVQTPFIYTPFIGPLAEPVTNIHWRWIYWAFAIIMPVVLCPLAGIFQYYLRVAEARGVYRRPGPSGRSPAQSINYYIQKFDLVGDIMLKAAFVLFLLPLTMYNNSKMMYDSPMFIVPLAVGGSLLGLYGLWQRYGTRNELLDIRALKMPAIIGCFAFAFIFNFSFAIWQLFNENALIMYYNLSLSSASYAMQIYNIGAVVGGMLFGLAAFFTRRFKPICLYLGLPLMILGLGLMINVRGTGGSSNVGYIIGCHVVVGLAGGTLNAGSQLVVTVSVERESIPIMLFLLQMCQSLGSSIGFPVSSVIKNSTFPSALKDALPAGNKTMSESLSKGDYTVQNSFPVGSEIRGAIDTAWEVYLQRAYIISTAVLVAGIPAVAVWKNLYLNQKQNKGVMI